MILYKQFIMIGKNIFHTKRYILIYSILIEGFCHSDMIFCILIIIEFLISWFRKKRQKIAILFRGVHILV